jgi:hypothetical protein
LSLREVKKVRTNGQVIVQEEWMPDQNEQDTQKSEMRVMWIMSAVIVLFILGLMAFNMLTHPDWMHGM